MLFEELFLIAVVLGFLKYFIVKDKKSLGFNIIAVGFVLLFFSALFPMKEVSVFSESFGVILKQCAVVAIIISVFIMMVGCIKLILEILSQE